MVVVQTSKYHMLQTHSVFS